jgi:hypothetical protein
MSRCPTGSSGPGNDLIPQTQERYRYTSVVLVRQRRSFWTNRISFLRNSSCCQMRRTFQPACFKNLFTILSRSLFLFSFRFQNSTFVTGRVACLGQPCQKHPSTNTARRADGKTKSGLPKRGWPLRQPEILYLRRILISASSVDLLARPWMRDMSCERCSTVKVSKANGYRILIVTVVIQTDTRQVGRKTQGQARRIFRS